MRLRGRTYALVAVCGLVLVFSSMATADHNWNAGNPSRVAHWPPQPGSPYGSGGGEYRPWVSAPAQDGAWANPAHSKWPYTSAAEWRWQTVGHYYQGFVVGAAAPNIACPTTSTPYVTGSQYPPAHPGGIIVCYTTWADPDLQRTHPDPQQRFDGATHHLLYSGAPWHRAGALVKVCGDCWELNNIRTHQVMTHEYGHAIGLGHTFAYSNCVMNYNSPTETPCGHDSWAVDDTYNHFNE